MYWLDCLMFIIFFSNVAIILLWHSLLKDKQSVTKAHRWGLCRRYTAYGLLYMSINCNWGCREVIIPFILFSVKWNPRLVCFNIDTHLDKPEKMSIRGWPYVVSHYSASSVAILRCQTILRLSLSVLRWTVFKFYQILAVSDTYSKRDVAAIYR